MKVDNSHNESRALDALMKVMRASDDTGDAVAGGRSVDAGSRHPPRPVSVGIS